MDRGDTDGTARRAGHTPWAAFGTELRTALGTALAALVLVTWAAGIPAATPRGTSAPGQAARSPAPTSGAQQAAERVVSLLPAATQILLEIGAADRLVARLESDRHPAVAALPSAGDVLSPNAEVIAALRPDLLIVWVGTALGPLTELLDAQGARVQRLAVDRLTDVAPAIRTIGGWVGRRDRADSVAAAFDRSIADARARGRDASASAGGRPSVLWVVSADPIVVVGPGSFLSDLIDVVGGANAAARTRSPWPRLGIESLVGLDPDVLVWPDGPDLFPATELPSRAGWQTLEAVRAGRVLTVEGAWFHDAGPGLAPAALELGRRLAEMSTRR
jgi:ABC-type Fe3+-hydroxamate transport system substrate-binding protein